MWLRYEKFRMPGLNRPVQRWKGKQAVRTESAGERALFRDGQTDSGMSWSVSSVRKREWWWGI